MHGSARYPLRNVANATIRRRIQYQRRGGVWRGRALTTLEGVKKVGDPRGILRGRESPNLPRAELHRAGLGKDPAARSGADMPPRF